MVGFLVGVVVYQEHTWSHAHPVLSQELLIEAHYNVSKLEYSSPSIIQTSIIQTSIIRTSIIRTLSIRTLQRPHFIMNIKMADLL